MTGTTNHLFDLSTDWPPDRIREAREARGWTQDQLAQAVEASLRSVVAWEGGTYRPGRRFIHALDRAFSAERAAPPGPPPTDAQLARLLSDLAQLLSDLGATTTSGDTVFRRGDPAELIGRDGLLLPPANQRTNRG